MDFEREIVKLLKKRTKLEEIKLEIPSNDRFGDYAFPCFELAKRLKKSPAELAKEFVNIKASFLDKVEVVGPYVNFFVNRNILAKNVLSEIIKEKNRYGSKIKKKEKVMVEFSQANTHKAFHIGHVRGTSLGESLSRILEFSGYKVIRANYQGDTGMHVAKWIWYYKKFLRDKKVPKKNIEKWIASIYVNAVNKINEENQGEVDKINLALELGKDKELMSLWKKTRKLSLDSFEIIYRDLNTRFDYYFFEREVEKRGKELAKQLVKRGIAKIVDGATVIDLEKYGLGFWVLLRKDGTVLYSAKDIALAELKFKKYKIDRSIYVVGAEQRTHLLQLFKTLELMNFKQAKNCVYIPVSEVRLPTGKMSSRTGENVIYSDFKEEILDYAKSEIKKRYERMSDKEINRRALAISIGAIKFSMLKQDLNKTIIFDKEEALRFEGDTGPYVQYAYARCSSILKKSKTNKSLDFSSFNDLDYSLVKILRGFPGVVEKSCSGYKPYLIANYLLELVKKFNEFYVANPVLKAEKKLKEARLVLVFSVRQVLKNGLNLLGIDALEEM